MSSTESNPFYLVPVQDAYVLHAPLHGLHALINGSAAAELQKILCRGGRSDDEQISELAASLKEDTPQFPGKPSGGINPDFLGIIPTRGCNSRCLYCDFGALETDTRQMPPETAARAVDWYASVAKSKGSTTLAVHFFGGEPMTATGVVTVAVHRARLDADRLGLMPHFEISTNGQYGERWGRFLGDYFNSVVLSMDGREEEHNAQRPGGNGKNSFQLAAATAHVISDSQADLCIRACVSNVNIAAMEDITDWFCRIFNPTSINFEVLQHTALTEKSGLESPSPRDFAISLVRSRAVAARYGVELVYASDMTSPQWTSCPVGKDTAIVTPDGKVSSCYLLPERWQHRGLEMTFGQIGKDIEIDQARLESIRCHVENKPGCEQCFCRWSCAGGCQVENERPLKHEGYGDFCIQTRIISLCSLLDSLGAEEHKEALLNDLRSIERLANHPDDRLEMANVISGSVEV